METVLDKLQWAKIFTTLDLTNGFFHVPIKPGSRKYTSFLTQSGQFEFLYVPFGIPNSPAVFTRFIMAVLRELIATNVVVVYMGDVIKPSQNFEERLANMKDVLQVASRNGKCQILHSKVQFLGYITQSGTITPVMKRFKV